MGSGKLAIDSPRVRWLLPISTCAVRKGAVAVPRLAIESGKVRASAPRFRSGCPRCRSPFPKGAIGNPKGRPGSWRSRRALGIGGAPSRIGEVTLRHFFRPCRRDGRTLPRAIAMFGEAVAPLPDSIPLFLDSIRNLLDRRSTFRDSVGTVCGSGAPTERTHRRSQERRGLSMIRSSLSVFPADIVERASLRSEKRPRFSERRPRSSERRAHSSLFRPVLSYGRARHSESRRELSKISRDLPIFLEPCRGAPVPGLRRAVLRGGGTSSRSVYFGMRREVQSPASQRGDSMWNRGWQS